MNPAHKYARYTLREGKWHSPGTGNMSEHAYNIVSAGRGLNFNLKDVMPESYKIYKQHEIRYWSAKGDHTYHSLTEKEYETFLNELWAAMEKYPCDRGWMLKCI